MTAAYSTPEGLRIAGQIVPPGTHRIVTVPVFTDLDNSEIALVIHAYVGTKPGPVIGMHTTLHGGEWQPIESFRRLADGLNPAEMTGAVLLLPVANPLALWSRTRNTRDESDSPDLNRSFGGTQTWIADQLAGAITEHFLKASDVIIDFHCGLWGAAMFSVTCGRDYANPEVSRRSFELARAFGHPYIRRSDFVSQFPGPKSSVGYAGQQLGIPGFVVEIGGAGFDPATEERWYDMTVEGLRRVLRAEGVLPGAAPDPIRVMLFRKIQRVNPRNGGMLEPVVRAEEMMVREVAKGELLGRVWDAHSFEVVEELRSPFRGLLDMAPRDYPARPGYWAYLVVDLDDPDTRWLEPDQQP
jgi:hypothetical protein